VGVVAVGVEAARAIRARQREAAARVARLIAKRDQDDPVGGGRRARIQAAVRDGRRALRARDAAQAAVAAAETEVGAALARITAEGGSLHDAAVAMGLSNSVGRRLLKADQESTRHPGGVSSTGRSAQRDTALPASRRDPRAAANGGATAKGSL
jgi:hypothetical protein